MRTDTLISKTSNYLLISLLVISYTLFVSTQLQISELIQIGADEGYELIKAYLLSLGHPLYLETWNDQPPLHTFLLAQIFKFFSADITYARYLSLFSCIILLLSFSFILLNTKGLIAAVLGILLLTASPHFAELSASAMLELPAMSFGMLSFAFFLSFLHKKNNFSLYVSAVIFALALQIKLTNVIFIFPLLYIGLKSTSQIRLKNNLMWLAIVISVWTLITMALNVKLQGFFDSHVHKSFGQSFSLLLFAKENIWPFSILLLSSCFAYQYLLRDVLFQCFLFFLAGVCAIHLLHSPYWYYYEIHMQIPLLFLTAYAFSKALNRLKNKVLYLTVITAVISASLFFNYKSLSKYIAHLNRGAKLSKSKSLEGLASYSSQTNWIFTDKPAYAFHSKLKIPPELAVIPKKRIKNQLLNEVRKIELLEKYMPEQILLFKKVEPKSIFEIFLIQHYRRVSPIGQPLHFIRKD